MKQPIHKKLKAHLDKLPKGEFRKKWLEIKKMRLEGPSIEEYQQMIKEINSKKNDTE